MIHPILADGTTRHELERDLMAQGFSPGHIAAECDRLERRSPRMVASGRDLRGVRTITTTPWLGGSPSPSSLVCPGVSGVPGAASGTSPSNRPCSGSGADAVSDGGLVGGMGKPQGYCPVCGAIVDVVTVGGRVVLDVHGGE